MGALLPGKTPRKGLGGSRRLGQDPLRSVAVVENSPLTLLQRRHLEASRVKIRGRRSGSAHIAHAAVPPNHTHPYREGSVAATRARNCTQPHQHPTRLIPVRANSCLNLSRSDTFISGPARLILCRARVGCGAMSAGAPSRKHGGQPRLPTCCPQGVDGHVGQIHYEDVLVIPPAHHLQKKFSQFRFADMTITNCPQTEPWPQRQVRPPEEPLSS